MADNHLPRHDNGPKGGFRASSHSSSPDLIVESDSTNPNARVVSDAGSTSSASVIATDESKPRRLLSYHSRPLWLLVFYLPLLIVPWALTCSVAYRWRDGGSFLKSAPAFKTFSDPPRMLLAAKILAIINAVVAIPVMSALIAQAAVVYCQKRRTDQKLNMRQMFALADRGWTDFTIILHASKTGSSFLWLAFVLIVISAIQQPLQLLLVSHSPIVVKTCRDLPLSNCQSLHIPVVLGYDPEPIDMALLQQNIVVQDVASDISSRTQWTQDPHLWTEYPYNNDEISGLSNPWVRQTIAFYNIVRPGETFFATTLANGTTTGSLRYHAMRLNTSIECEVSSPMDFPETCEGDHPFTASFSRPGMIETKVCVPGNQSAFPWTHSRNRQDLVEVMYLQNVATKTSVGDTSNFTTRCVAVTSRGYFELGNIHNGFKYGPLKAKWPTPREIEREFDDHRGLADDYAPPTELEEDNREHRSFLTLDPMDPFGTKFSEVPGPLMTSAIAIFGKGSFFHTASLATNTTWPPAVYQICAQNRIPFSRLGWSYFWRLDLACLPEAMDGFLEKPEDHERSEYRLRDLMNVWVRAWRNAETAVHFLKFSTFIANRAHLIKTVEASKNWYARPIQTSPGKALSTPVLTTPIVVMISILIFVQLVGIILLTAYIYWNPTWTASLDALATARIGADLRDLGQVLPPIRPLENKEVDELSKLDGLVGISEEESSVTPESAQAPRLSIGGPGIVARRIYKTDSGV